MKDKKGVYPDGRESWGESRRSRGGEIIIRIYDIRKECIFKTRGKERRKKRKIEKLAS